MSNLLDFCRMTSSTGGTGALTLTAQTGYPAVSDAITGTRFVNYSVAEYTSSAKSQLAKAESGIGSYVASTGILTRTTIKTTWDGTNYLPKFGTATAPTALSFGTTSTNIDITVSAISSNIIPTTPFVYGAVGSVSDGLGTFALNASVISSGTMAMATGTVYYCPILLGHNGPFTQISMRTGATLTGGSPTFDAAIYEINSDGSPGKKLIAFTQFTGFGAVGTYSSAALATPVALPPGWYWVGCLYIANSATGSFQVKASLLLTGGPGGGLFANGTAVNAPLTLASQTALNDPATAPTGNFNTNNAAPGFSYK